MTSGDTSKGKQLFTQKCGSCHTLGDAKSAGTIGPNLDDAFASDKSQGFSQQTMADVVRGQIAYPDPEGPMKANLVSGGDADSVALYIAKCSANPNCGVTAAGSQGGVQTGKQIFTTNCASCHTLKDAGATGKVGPDLDTLKPPEPVVAHQVEVGGGAMPAFKGTLTPAEIKLVAKYVASVAGK